LTEEFCGNKTVTRPSCGDSGIIDRVIGYYEGWAPRRGCQTFAPDQIPIGIYTHINFAFASINPTTFEVVPANSADIPLYTQLTSLKKQQPDLKVYIAIGGWTFTDPGPTGKFNRLSD
jgi:chitinase